MSPPMPSLPTVVQAEVGRRRAAIVARAGGRVLDLDRVEGRARLHATMAGPPAAAERYDSIISTCALMDEPDLGAAIAALDRLLAPDGDLWLVEPVNHPGPAGLLWSSLGASLPAVAGRHVSRDVIRTARAAGLTAADLDRFTIATRVWPLRRFVEARIIRIERPRDAGADPAGPSPERPA